jgi:predicted nuclease with TOPRIM domain
MEFETKDLTVEDLANYAKSITDELKARYYDLSGTYKDVWKSYGDLQDEHSKLKSCYNELKEKYEDLTQEESGSQYEYEAYNEGFENGEQSMQEKANKICEYWEDNNTAVLSELFDGWTWTQIFENIETAYDKIIEYEKKEKEIKVGDEVVDRDGTKYVVRFLNDSYADALAYNGVSVECDYADISKTGKHYPLDEMLKELENE